MFKLLVTDYKIPQWGWGIDYNDNDTKTNEIMKHELMLCIRKIIFNSKYINKSSVYTIYHLL